MYGYTHEEAIGQRKEVLLKSEVPGSSFEEVTNKLREEGIWSGELLSVLSAMLSSSRTLPTRHLAELHL